MSHPMIDNPRFCGMTLDEARKLEQGSRGFRDLSDREVWALRMVHDHDLQALTEVARTVELCALDVRDGKAAPEDTRATLVDDLLSAVATLRTLAERPAEPGRDDECTCGHEYATHVMNEGSCLHAKQCLCTGFALAARPAEPDPDLVAAMYDALQDAIRARRDLPRHQKHRYSDIEAMAAVAQARIDAAVDAERRRIRGELRDLRDDSGGVITAHHALAVVDEGAQR